MFYPAIFTESEEGGFVVTFPDIPEAITQGDSFEEAMEMAEDVLLSSIEIYFDDDRVFPEARKPLDKETLVQIPPSVYAKVLLNNCMLQGSVTKAELARLSSIRPPEVQRVLDVRHSTKIDTINNALKALGKNLTLSICS